MSLSRFESLFREVREAVSVAAACHALAPIFDMYKVISLDLTRGSIYWRSRLCEAEPWAAASQMSAPPPERTLIGRLNDAGCPMLYASLKQETALAEIQASASQHVQLIGYRTLVGKDIRLAVVGEMMHVHKFGYMRLTGADPSATLGRLLNEKGLIDGRQLLYIDAFLHHLLSDPAADAKSYVLSRAVAAMIHRDVAIDGIAYPSARDPIGYNITLKPEVVVEKMHPTSCLHCRIDALHEFGFVEYTVLKEAARVDDAGRFEWMPPLAPPRRRLFNLTKEEYEAGIRLKDDPSAFMEFKRVHQ